jgi:signal transduction histidine kinase
MLYSEAMKNVLKRSSWSWNQFFYPLLGLAIGTFYAVLDEKITGKLIQHKTHYFRILYTFHDLIDIVLPIVLGLVVGIGFNMFVKQERLNRELSLQNTQFQKNLLINNLISLFLHEIRNPIHNITAVLEDSKAALPAQTQEIIGRNLKRFEQITAQYKRWSSVFDVIHAKKETDLRPWMETFISDKVWERLRSLNIRYSQEIESLRVQMHPILLDQVFSTLFSNVCDALENDSQVRAVKLSAKLSPSLYEQIEIRLSNTTGHGFPAEVLEKQGRSPVMSRKGLGLGLTLLRNIVEHVGGEMMLSNGEGVAEVTLLIPGVRL